MSPSRRIILYSVVRLVLFVVPFVVLMLVGMWPWLAAITAAVIATCISYLFLNKQRDEVAGVVSTWGKKGPVDVDNDIENDALDRTGVPPRAVS